MTEKQIQLLNFAKGNGGEISKKEAVAVIGQSYYCNAGKHTGEVLSRMVKARLLVRVKIGFYRIGSVQAYTHINKTKYVKSRDSQISLF